MCQNGSNEWSLSTSISTFLALTCTKFLSLHTRDHDPNNFWFISDLLSEIIMILCGHVSLIECLKWVCLNVVAPNLMLHHQFPVFQHSYVGMSRIPPPFSEHPTSQDLCFANHWPSNPGPTSSHIVFSWSASLRLVVFWYISPIFLASCWWVILPTSVLRRCSVCKQVTGTTMTGDVLKLPQWARSQDVTVIVFETVKPFPFFWGVHCYWG